MAALSSGTIVRPPISAAIICHDERPNIGRCLQSLYWCEQIVAVDSGSTDGTPDIVRRYPNTKVLHRPFDNFAAQRNFCLDHCDHDWVLSIDADEVVSPALVEAIDGAAFDVAGYRISFRTFLGDEEIKYGTWNPDYHLRLFRKSRGRWGGPNPHESVVLEGATARLGGKMLHFSYQCRQEFVDRNRHYACMAVDYLIRSGRRTYWGEPVVHWFGNFFKAYVLRLGFLDRSAGLFLAYHMAKVSYSKYRLLGKRLRELEPGGARAAEEAAEKRQRLTA